MSMRCLTVAALLLLAAVCTHAPGQAPATPPEYVVPPADDARWSTPPVYPEKPLNQGPTKARLEMRVYQVADLIIPLEKNPAVLDLPPKAPPAPVQQAVATVPTGPKTWSAGTEIRPACASAPATTAVSPAATASQKTLEDRLIKLLTSRIAPESWSAKGGPGTVDYYPLGMALVINQTPAVHKKIAHVLESLRKLQDVEVALEVRLVSVSEPFFERIGINFDGDAKGKEGKPAEKPATLPAGVTFLDDKQLKDFLEVVQGDQRANVLQAPKLTVANGQSATLNISDVQYYVTGLDTVRKGGQTVVIPKNEPMTTGFQMSVQPAVSSDRRYVELNLKVTYTGEASPNVPLYPIVYTVTPELPEGSQGKPLLFTQFIQQPVFYSCSLEKTATIPDGNSMLLGGWKRVRETRTEFGPPVLSKIPYFNRLFKNAGYGRETETVVLLVTPRIIVNERKESAPTVADRKAERAKEKKATVFVHTQETPGADYYRRLELPPEADPAKGEETEKAKKVVKLLKKYLQAVKEGRREDEKLVYEALELVDPGCSAYLNHYSSDPNRRIAELLDKSEDLRQIEYEWEHIWFNDQPSHLCPEPRGSDKKQTEGRELRQIGYETKESEDLDGAAGHRFEQAELYYALAREAAEKMCRPEMKYPANWAQAREECESWAGKAEAGYTELMQELQDRLTKRPLSKEEEQLLRRTSFAAAECRFLQGEYGKAIGLYEALAIRYERQPDGLHALAALARCYWLQKRAVAAQAAVERVRAMLKEMKDTDFQKSRLTRQQWEDWLAEVSKQSWKEQHAASELERFWSGDWRPLPSPWSVPRPCP
jgi:hypothetical protein